MPAKAVKKPPAAAPEPEPMPTPSPVRAMLIVACFGTTIGFAAGAFLSGDVAFAIASVVLVSVNAIVDLLLVAPRAGKLAKERFLAALAEPSEEDAELVQTAVARMAESAGFLMEEDSERGKAIRNFVDLAVARFMNSMERSADAALGGVMKNGYRLGDMGQDAALEAMAEIAGPRLGIAPKKAQLGLKALAWLSRRKQQQEGDAPAVYMDGRPQQRKRPGEGEYR